MSLSLKKWNDDYAARKAGHVDELIQAYPILGKFLRLSQMLIEIKNQLHYFIELKLFPLLILRDTFQPPINVYTGYYNGKTKNRKLDGDNDILLAYFANEIISYHEQGIKHVIQIRHPLVDACTEVMRFLYGEIDESDMILITPSYGFTSRLIVQGWSEDQVIRHVADRWYQAIDRLLQRFPGFTIKIKLHPSSRSDPIWRAILDQLVQQLPQMVVVDPGTSAEKLIVEAKVIVGDVSNVLWWAGIIGNKVVISLDIFSYPGGDELSSYPSTIYYKTDLNFDDVEVRTHPCHQANDKDLNELFPIRPRLTNLHP
ncbi:MAG: hypothetical protein HQL73_05560 [Magnetococcales bacterium]|nr:hypothetical protein [Magnetococcales bacterium]